MSNRSPGEEDDEDIPDMDDLKSHLGDDDNDDSQNIFSQVIFEVYYCYRTRKKKPMIKIGVELHLLNKEYRIYLSNKKVEECIKQDIE